MFTLEINTDNAAFHDDDGLYPWPELSRILQLVYYDIETNQHVTGTLRDINGNHVGSWSLDMED